MEFQDNVDISGINIYLWGKNDDNSLFDRKATINYLMGSKQEIENVELHFIAKGCLLCAKQCN